MPAKLGANLAEQLRRADPSALLDVIVQLRGAEEPGATAGEASLSRAEKIVARKEAFRRNMAGIEKAVQQAGGEVTALAWINQTARARLTPRGVQELCQNERIAALDAPAPLTPETE
jgi:hypothetical protein